MAEDIARQNQYTYMANSNLVLEADRDSRGRRGDEPTGEVESLWGRMGGQKMGDRAARGRPPELEEKLKKAKSKREREALEEAEGKGKKKKKESSRSAAAAFAAGRGATVLTATEDLGEAGQVYQPKTREARAAYEGILSAVQGALGDQPRDVLRGAADEVIALLKDEHLRDPERQAECGALLGTKLPADRFAQLVQLGKRLTDYRGGDEKVDEEEGDADAERLDEELGVAVVFHDEDEEAEESDLDEVRDSEDEEEADGGADATAGGMLRGGDDDAPADEDQDALRLNVHDIDAHWLQRQLSKYYDDAHTANRLAGEVLEALDPRADGREVETRLVVLLDFDKFDFIKVLLRNRAAVRYCTLLKQAQDPAARAAVEEEMAADAAGGGAAILEQLRQTATAESWQQDRMGEFAAKARREARGLQGKEAKGKKDSKGGGGGGGGGDEAAMDLDEEEEEGGGGGREPAAAAAAGEEGGGGGRERGGGGGGGGAGGRPGTHLDLEALAFAQGSHLMSNKRCELPAKSWRAQKKGYEEVHVPARKTAVPPDEVLVDVEELPAWAQKAFDGMATLNRVQSKMYKAAFEDQGNLLLCAPTGAGKTNVAMLCMLNLLGQHLKDDGSVDLDAFKIVYVAPMKALVQEVVLNFGKRLAPYGVTVKELSGDQSLTRQQIQETQVIVTTPEKWDIITRKAGDRTYTQLVRLMIIDEVHLLHDDRGPVLEALVARTVRRIETTQEMVRLVGLSATLPNYEDVAHFLRVKPDKGLFYFDNSFRPVPLQQQYIGITEKKALKRFQLMNEICYEKVLAQAGKNQVLIFVHSRAETAKTARALRDLALERDDLAKFIREDSATREILQSEAETAKDEALKDVLPYGFAVHHAGLQRGDRNLVEDLFADKHVQVLVSTATLAWGVNLPAHTVILKGTQMYHPGQGKWVELSPLDVLQMVGRAGRPQYDKTGEAILLTQHSELQYYLSLNNQQLPVESQLVSRLPDYLNAEVALGSVQTVKEAAHLLGYTYLYVRMLRNPALYGARDIEGDPYLERHRLDLVHAAVAQLDKHAMVRYDRKAGTLQGTALGRVASHYYVSHASVATYNEYLKPAMSDIELFRLFSLSAEFKHIHVREEEKAELQKLAARVPVPVKEGMEEPSAKVNVLLQAYISGLKLEGFALVADMTHVQQSAVRILRALTEIAFKRGWAALADRALSLCKMVERRMWLSQTPLRQFRNVPEPILRKLERKELAWNRYYDLKPADLGELVKLPKMGRTLHRLVHQFPRLELGAHVQPLTRQLLRVDLTLTPDFAWDQKVHEGSQLFHVLVEDVDGERLLHHEPFLLRAQYAEEPHHLSFTVPVFEPLPPQYFLKVVSDRWLHSEAVVPVVFRHLVLPQKAPPPTELLDLQPLPVSALRDAAFEGIYARQGFRLFNPVQTQAFTELYDTDDNVLVCAPAGSGKTVCAEFALLRLLKTQPGGRCVYVAPKEEIAAQRHRDWAAKFGTAAEHGLGLSVVRLTGETAADLRLLAEGRVVIATAEQWDVVSRRWKQRKNVQEVALFLVDELHLLGAAEGPALEVVVSRARYVASQLERKVRIVGLSSSLANAKDVGDWMGATAHSNFNFHPNVRPVPLELFIQGSDVGHFGSRMLAFGKTVYNAIVGRSPDKPAIVFVPGRKQAQLTAIDLVTHAAAEGGGGGDAAGGAPRFLGAAPEDVAPVLKAVKEPGLAQALAAGVGYLHAGTAPADRQRVEGLYRDGVIRVLVVPASMCWELDARAHLVVVMGTESYDGKEHKYTQYPITDILQMMGLACRPLQDASGKAVLLCHAPQRPRLRKLVYDPLPIESHLDHFLHDHINAEVVTKTIENKQDAVDYLTWTFFYRRLGQNPNYYNLADFTHRHLSDHLSELVERVVGDLEESRCLAVEDEMAVAPLNLGMIAAYYHAQYTTVELFAASAAAKTKLRGLVEILASASEYAALPVRRGEEAALRRLAAKLPNKLPDGAKYADPATKCNVLLQCHFSRVPLGSDLKGDQRLVVGDALRLLQAMVDVISSNGWLRPALAAMELAQMLVQALWDRDPPLLQVPHFTRETCRRCEEAEVETVFDVLGLEDADRDRLLGLPPAKLARAAAFCNAYPNVDLNYEVQDPDQITAGDPVNLVVTLERELDEEEGEGGGEGGGGGGGADGELGKVFAPLYPKAKAEGWWLVVGAPKGNLLLSIKRVALQRRARIKLDFMAPEGVGKHDLVLYFMCDSYLGCDQEYEFTIDVAEAESGSEEDDSEEES